MNTMTTQASIQAPLKAFTQTVRNLYGERLERIVLFGSFARGTAHENSDVDVAVVLRGAVQPMEEIDAIVAATYNINLEYGILLAVYPVAAERYYDEQSPLLINIRKEGLVV
jgi:predicted nucleotidyltransferase